MTTYSRSVQHDLTLTAAPTTGGGTFNVSVVHNLNLGQKQGRNTNQSIEHALTFSDFANQTAREVIQEALYFTGIVAGINAGKIINQTLNLNQSVSHQLDAIRILESELTFSHYVSAFIVGEREKCILSSSGNCVLSTITIYDDQISSAINFAHSVVVAGTFNANVLQNLNLVQTVETESTFNVSVEQGLAFNDSANQGSISVPTASSTLTLTGEATGEVV